MPLRNTEPVSPCQKITSGHALPHPHEQRRGVDDKAQEVQVTCQHQVLAEAEVSSSQTLQPQLQLENLFSALI